MHINSDVFGQGFGRNGWHVGTAVGVYIYIYIYKSNLVISI